MTDHGHWEWSDETGPRGNLREAVAVFDDADRIQDAVDDLELHGFSNAAISRPVSPELIEESLQYEIHSVEQIEDNSEVPREAFVDMHSRAERTIVLLFIPVYIGASIAIGIAAANGMETWQTITLILMMSLIGIAAGGIYSYRMFRRKMDRIKREEELGGHVLWVRTGNIEQENKALLILSRNKGHHVHMHGPLNWPVH